MNLNAVANAVTQAITPNVVASVKRSTGWTKTPDYHRVPTNTTIDGVVCQVQAVGMDDLKQIDGLNIQGTTRVIYANIRLEGVNRSSGKGGDLVMISAQTGYVPLGGTSFDTWLVEQILEGWDTPDWTRALIRLQVQP